MPNLSQTLLKYDLGHLKIIADLWGLEIQSRDVDSAVEELCPFLQDPAAVQDTMDVLPAEARAALAELAACGGKIEWGLFARTFGEIREMGRGRRDRETPHLKPTSAAEILFYRGLLAKAFFESGRGTREFAYIPDDLVPLIGQHGDEKQGGSVGIFGRLAIPTEKSVEYPANDRVLDDSTTLLAALRAGRSDFKSDPRLHTLLMSGKIIRKNVTQSEAVRNFLGSSRAGALDMLYETWLDSQTFDELRLIPEIICEGEWTNSPRETRHIILGFLNALPNGKWWSLPAFLRDLKAKHPDFQRPAGDYDSWFIKRVSDGQYLRGFVHWDEVDGAVVKSIVQMYHLLGRADLACPEENGAITSFRLTTIAGNTVEKGKLSIASNGKITVPRLFPRAVRYQLARFCEWDDDDGRAVVSGSERRSAAKPDEYVYRIGARSLEHAEDQGLKATQLLALLVKHTKGNVPPALVKALKRWEANGAEARVENLSVLRVSRPEILVELRRSRAGKYLGEVLSPTAAVVREGAIQKVIAALTELGLLAEMEIHE